MDALAVSIAKGITVNTNRRKSAILLASFFGGFQMLMPAIGWLIGLSFKELIMGVDHWIAFGLLTFIGSKMIYDSTKKKKKTKKKPSNYIPW
jgi:manganese efflux pump family protein